MFCPFSRVCPTGTMPYTVKPGDSFATLAQQFHTTVAAIVAANPGVNPNSIRVGQVICIPMGHPMPPCPSGIRYTVKAGDTVASIARSFNISVIELLEANPGVNPNMLVVGSVLCIPHAKPPMTCPPGTTEYIVRAGDTLQSIARKFNTTVRDILRVNPNLGPDSLRVGQKICIPRHTPPMTCPPGTTEYIVRAGDTLQSIARRFGTSVGAIIQANPGVLPNNLHVGQKLCIPGPKGPRELAAMNEDDDETLCPHCRQCPMGTTPYTIKAGDTFVKLAQEFGTTVTAIIAANPGVNPNALKIGQEICLPMSQPMPPCPAGTTPYTIKAGDTFASLAPKFNTTVENIRLANPNVNPNALVIGQIICIPGPVTCAAGSQPYVIKAGDTFFVLANRFGVTVEAIRNANPNTNPNALHIGDTICIPSNTSTFTNTAYNVSFMYPANWHMVEELRYEGPNGFFQIAAISSSGTLDEVCHNEASHLLRPYGTNPTTTHIEVQGNNACLILPSADQPAEMRMQAAVIVKYPKPVEISGQSYNYFILWADKNHIRQIASTLRFLTT